MSVEQKPRLLDLFCGAGGAGYGYHLAGFEVVGVDHRPQPHYPFELVRADALHFLRTFWWLHEFDAIHASPPCQLFSAATRDRSKHEDLITPLRPLLEATGLPYVIENVPGAPLHDPVTICGSSLGLKVRRHRLFETNWPLIVPPCAHGQQGQPVGVYGEGSSKGQKRGRKADNEAEVLSVMEMPWADRAGATTGHPPGVLRARGFPAHAAPQLRPRHRKGFMSDSRQKRALTEPQRRHLTELAAIHDQKGAAFWVPSGSGEMRCAGLLSRRGYLRAHYMGYSGTQYELTDEGRAAVSPALKGETR